MRLRLVPLWVVVATVVGVWPGSASAQSVSLPNPTPERSDDFPRDMKLQWINFNSCVADDVLTFRGVTLAGTANTRFEVWAGETNCATDTARFGDMATCWKVYEEFGATLRDGIDDIPIKARDIVGGLARRGHRGQNTGQDTGTCNDCFSNTAEGTVTLHFMLVSPDGQREAELAANFGEIRSSDPLEVDVVGPSAPTLLKAGVGENRLVLKWEHLNAEDDVEDYHFFCDSGSGVPDAPIVCPDVTAGAGGAGGTPGTNDSPDAGSVNPNCPGTALVQGQRPPGSLFCGRAAGSAEGETDQNLENGAVHSVGIASVDTLGNIGLLSNIDCAAPQPVVDFFEAYRREGGKGGGGFCTVSRPGAPLAGWLFVLAGLAWLRRRRA